MASHLPPSIYTTSLDSTVTTAPEGMRIALFFTRAHARFFRTGLSLESPFPPTRASRAFSKASQAVDQLIEKVKLAA